MDWYRYSNSYQPLVYCSVLLLDFVENEYTFGRSEDCDYCFEKNGGRTNPQFRTFSNTHFRIYKVILINY